MKVEVGELVSVDVVVVVVEHWVSVLLTRERPGGGHPP